MYFMKLNDCNNFQDFRKLAKPPLPPPIFDYIDGAADDEQTYLSKKPGFWDTKKRGFSEYLTGSLGIGIAHAA